MTHFIKGEDGRFVGSIGIGKNNVPTASADASQPSNHPTAATAPNPTDIHDVYARYQGAPTGLDVADRAAPAAPDATPSPSRHRLRRYAPEALFAVPAVAAPAAAAATGSTTAAIVTMAVAGVALSLTSRLYAALPMAARYRRLNLADQRAASTPATRPARTREPATAATFVTPPRRRRRRGRGRGKRH